MEELNTPFEIKSLIKPTIFHKIFKVKPKANFLIEINNLLATKKIIEITLEDIEKLATKYKINPFKKFKDELKKFYYNYLEYCLNDYKFSNEEINNLKHLKSLLGLSDKEIEEINNQVYRDVYSKGIDEIISDGKISKEEKIFLENLKNELSLPEEIAQNIYNTYAQNYYKSILEEKIEDQMLSPEEEEELNILRKNLGIVEEHDENTKKLLDRYRLYWLINNGDIPTIDVNINLQKQEKCFFKANVDWYEYRKTPRRINYSGPTVRLKITKGFYWRIGSLNFQPISEEVLTYLDSGTIYLTNKRLIFIGNYKNQSIQLSKILDFIVYKNGVQLQKQTGRSPFLLFSDDIDLFAMILERVLRED